MRKASYEEFLTGAERSELHSLSAQLRGARVVHINATPSGGGVAELLSSLVPLSRDVGVDSTWFALPPDARIFDVTKRIHNWLQAAGARVAL
jgi:trehalose synthase